MKKYNIILSITIVIICIFSCSKDKVDVPKKGETNKIVFGSTKYVDTLLSYFSAKITSSVSSIGNSKISQYGHCWGIKQNPTIKDSKTTFNSMSVVKDIVSTLNELAPNTTYYVRPYITPNGGAAVYGKEINIKTLKTGRPDIETLKPKEVGLFSALCGGNIISDSGLVITECGLFWGKDSLALSKTNYLGIYRDQNTKIDSFNHRIEEGLEDGVRYFIQAYATNSAGTNYGNKKRFETGEIEPPKVNLEIDNSSITTGSFDYSMNVTDDGGTGIEEKGVCWGIVSPPTYEGNKTSNESGTISNLQDDTKYYVRAYAKNSKHIGYSELDSVTTIKIVPPTVKIIEVIDIGVYEAKIKWKVTSTGNGAISSCGVVLSSVNESPTIDEYEKKDNKSSCTLNEEYITHFTKLKENTTYYVRAYATNEKGTSYDKTDFKTLAVTIPVITTKDVSEISRTTAKSGGKNINSGNGTISAKGVVWGSSENPTLDNCLDKTNDGSGTTDFDSDITRLTPNTDYYVRAYATNEKGTGYGGESKPFKTEDYSLPVVQINSIDNITSSAADVNCEITDNGGATITERGICWSTNTTRPTDPTNHIAEGGANTGSYTESLSSLNRYTDYYVWAYAKNSKGTAYSIYESFKTKAEPPTITISYENLKWNEITLKGNITDDGGTDIIERGFYWGLNETNLNNEVKEGGIGSGMFSKTIELVTEGDNRKIYAQSYAVNKDNRIEKGKSGIIPIDLPEQTKNDFYIDNPTIDYSVAYPGMEIKVTCEQKYSGNSLETLTPWIRYYISTDDNWGDANDTYLGEDRSSLSSSITSESETELLDIPTNISSGVYYILFVSDYKKEYEEDNESNNVVSKQITVEKPDFYITNTSVSPSTISAGKSISVSCDQNYSGNISKEMKVYVGYYLSTDKDWDSGDELLSDDSSDLSSSSPNRGENENLTIPSNVSSGTYYILFVADYKEDYGETNELNNVNYEQIEIIETGNVTVKVYSIENKLVTDGRAWVKLFFNGGNSTKYTDSNGEAKFSEVITGNHLYKVYYKIHEEEFWGERNISFTGGNSTYTFNRELPIVKSITVKKAVLSSKRTITITIKNYSNTGYNVRLRICIDRNKNCDPGYRDYYHVSTTYLGSKEEKELKFDWTPSEKGTYYMKVSLDSEFDEPVWIQTDTYWWFTNDDLTK